MHDVDRTQLEAYESEEEWEAEGEEFLGGLTGPATQIIGGLVGGSELESPFSEMETMELASEMLEVQSEEELEEFLGDLVGKAASAIGSFVRSDTGRALTGIAKDVAKQALPSVGQALGGYFGPSGAQIGGQIASAAGNLLGLELEGLSAQEAELEAAKGVVRLTGAATAAAARAPRTAPPRKVARQAVQSAAQRHAPGLVGRGGQRPPRPRRPRGGTSRARDRRRRDYGPAAPTPAPAVAQAHGLPSWIVEDVRVSPPSERPYDGEPFAYDQDDGYEPDFGGGYLPSGARGRAATGRWERRGHHIVLLGA
jgi:hypothetical protein